MDRVEQAEEIAGHGIKAKIDGRVVYAGNAKLMEEKGVEYEHAQSLVRSYIWRLKKNSSGLS